MCPDSFQDDRFPLIGECLYFCAPAENPGAEGRLIRQDRHGMHAGAVPERVCAKIVHALRNSDLCQAGAPAESIFGNVFRAGWNGIYAGPSAWIYEKGFQVFAEQDAIHRSEFRIVYVRCNRGQIRAARECFFLNRGNALRKMNTGQGGTAVKEIRLQPADAVPEREIGQARAVVQDIRTGFGHRIRKDIRAFESTGEGNQRCNVLVKKSTAGRGILGIVCIHRKRAQSGAAGKRVGADLRYVLRDIHGPVQGPAAAESVLADVCDTGRNADSGQAFAAAEHIISKAGASLRNDEFLQGGAAAEQIILQAVAMIHMNAFQRSAAAEHMAAHAAAVVRNGDLCQRGTAAEGIVADARDIGSEGNLFKAGAAAEGIIVDDIDASRNDYTLHTFRFPGRITGGRIVRCRCSVSEKEHRFVIADQKAEGSAFSGVGKTVQCDSLSVIIHRLNGGTVREHVLPNAVHDTGECNMLQPCAPKECLVSNTCHIRRVDVRQRGTSLEHSGSNGCDSCRNHVAGFGTSCRIKDQRVPILANLDQNTAIGSIYRIAGIYLDFRQGRTVSEGCRINADHAGRNGYGSKAGAAAERVFSNSVQACRDRGRRQADASAESVLIDGGNLCRRADVHTLQGRTAAEGVRRDDGDTAADTDLLQRRTVLENTGIERHDVVRNGDGGQR